MGRRGLPYREGLKRGHLLGGRDRGQEGAGRRGHHCLQGRHIAPVIVPEVETVLW